MTTQEFEKLAKIFKNANDLIIEFQGYESDIEDLKKVIKEIKDNLEHDSNYYESYRQFKIGNYGGHKYAIDAEDAILVFERKIERLLSLMEVLQAKYESL